MVQQRLDREKKKQEQEQALQNSTIVQTQDKLAAQQAAYKAKKIIPQQPITSSQERGSKDARLQEDKQTGRITVAEKHKTLQENASISLSN